MPKTVSQSPKVASKPEEAVPGKEFSVKELLPGYHVAFGKTHLVVTRDGVTTAYTGASDLTINTDVISWGLLDELRGKLEASDG